MFFSLTAPDLRGFGDTGKVTPGPDPTATAAAHAQDVLALADTLGLERFGIVCGDVGAYVMQALARRAPERLSGVVSFCTPYPGIGARYGQPSHLIEVWYQYFQQLPFAAEVAGATRESCRRYIGWILDHWSGDDPTVFADTLEVAFFETPQVNLGGNQSLCDGESLTLDASTGQPATYLWQDGSSQPAFTASQSGTYSVSVTANDT